MARRRITVTEESDAGRNKKFRDNVTGEHMTRTQLVGKIKKGLYDDYHLRKINGLDTPVSNPNGRDNDKLG
ncbi:Uncharacterised protein [Halioglobus japonicus]|nr:Uncharacterised protein [Halioglobus japonicus]